MPADAIGPASPAAQRLRTPPPERPEGTRSNYDDLEGDVKAAVGRFISELWNKHDIAACDAFLAEDLVDHDPYPGQAAGRDGFRSYAADMLAAFPDVIVTIDDMIAQGSKIGMRLTWTATRGGGPGTAGSSPRGTRVTARQMEFVRVINGRIVERWAMVDHPWLTETDGSAPASSRPEIASTDDARGA